MTPQKMQRRGLPAIAVIALLVSFDSVACASKACMPTAAPMGESSAEGGDPATTSAPVATPPPTEGSSPGVSALPTHPNKVVLSADRVVTTAAPTDSPPPTANELLAAELQLAWDRLTEGSIAFPAELEMTQGVPVDVIARIARDPFEPSIEEGFATPPTVERLKVSATMEAELKERDLGTFQITALTPANQATLGPFAEWKWRVTALKSGQHRLQLTVLAIINLSNNQSRHKPLSKHANIRVKVNAPYVITTFIANYWQWLFGSPVVVGTIGWAWSRMKRGKSPRRVGF